MADDPYPLGPQPNLVNLSQGLRTAADEAEKLQNLAAFRDGNAIVAAIQDLSQQVQNQFQNLNNQIQILSQDLRSQLQARYVLLLIFLILS